MKYPLSRAYAVNETSGDYEASYIYNHAGATYVDEDETKTLIEKIIEVDASITSHETQITSNTNKIDNLGIDDKIKNIASPYVYNKPLISIVDDDGQSEFLTRLKPVYDAKGIKVTLGIVTDFVGTSTHMSLSELLQLQTEGYEIASHSKTHSQTIFQDNLINEPDASYDTEFSGSKTWLKNNGFGDCETIIYPFANFDSHSGVVGSAVRIKNIAKKYYRNAINADGWMNESPIDDMYVKRFFLDMTQFDLAAVKGIIDSAISLNAWLILGVHSWSTTQNDATYIGGIIDYIQSKSVDILPIKDAVKFKGNILSVGEYTSTSKGVFIGYTGKTKNNASDTRITALESEVTTARGASANLNTRLTGIDTSISQLSNPNLLINGDFKIWQRGTSITLPATPTAYTSDRWRLGTQTAGDIASKTDDGIKLTTTAGERYWLTQPMELDALKASELSGQIITISFWIKADVAFNAKVGYTINALTSDDTNTITYGVTTSYVKKSVTFTLPTLVSTDTLLNITPFRIDTAIQAQLPTTNVYIKQVKLELGSKATPFVPKSYGEELVLCQRYYKNKISIVGTANTVSILSVGGNLGIPMRTTPGITLGSYTAYPYGISEITITISQFSCTSDALGNCVAIAYVATSTTNLTVGRAYGIILTGLDAEIY